MAAKISGTLDYLAALQGRFGFADFARLQAGGKYTAVDLLNGVYAHNANLGSTNAARAAGLVAGVLTMEACKTVWPEQKALQAAAKAGKVATAHYAWAGSDHSAGADIAAVQAGKAVSDVITNRDFRDAGERTLAAQLALAGPSGLVSTQGFPQGTDDPPSLHALSSEQKAALAAGAVLGAGLLWTLLTRDKR